MDTENSESRLPLAPGFHHPVISSLVSGYGSIVINLAPCNIRCTRAIRSHFLASTTERWYPLRRLASKTIVARGIHLARSFWACCCGPFRSRYKSPAKTSCQRKFSSSERFAPGYRQADSQIGRGADRTSDSASSRLQPSPRASRRQLLRRRSFDVGSGGWMQRKVMAPPSLCLHTEVTANRGHRHFTQVRWLPLACLFLGCCPFLVLPENFL